MQLNPFHLKCELNPSWSGSNTFFLFTIIIEILVRFLWLYGQNPAFWASSWSLTAFHGFGVSAGRVHCSVLPRMWNGSQVLLSHIWHQGRERAWHGYSRRSKRTRRSLFLPVKSAHWKKCFSLSKETILGLPPTSSLNLITAVVLCRQRLYQSSPGRGWRLQLL